MTLFLLALLEDFSNLKREEELLFNHSLSIAKELLITWTIFDFIVQHCDIIIMTFGTPLAFEHVSRFMRDAVGGGVVKILEKSESLNLWINYQSTARMKGIRAGFLASKVGLRRKIESLCHYVNVVAVAVSLLLLLPNQLKTSQASPLWEQSWESFFLELRLV